MRRPSSFTNIVAIPQLQFRSAAAQDLPTLVALLADDAVAADRETAAVGATHEEALDAILADPNHHLLVAESDGALAGFAQLSFLPGLTYAGGWRAQLEGVRVAPGLRGQGVGQALIKQAIVLSRDRGCVLVQLTTDRRRPKAVGFYERLGFVASHHGMKLRLER
ncbi:MAG: GNAT family N-acetyltransferase [Pseudomonadota bacterium]